MARYLIKSQDCISCHYVADGDFGSFPSLSEALSFIKQFPVDNIEIINSCSGALKQGWLEIYGADEEHWPEDEYGNIYLHICDEKSEDSHLTLHIKVDPKTGSPDLDHIDLEQEFDCKDVGDNNLIKEFINHNRSSDGYLIWRS